MPQMFIGIGIALGIGNTKAAAAPSAPVNVTPPTIAGTPTVGSTLTATPGTWTGAAPITYAYQWERNGVDIPGATSLTYVVDALDEDTLLQIKETATNSVGSEVQYSFPFSIPIPISGTHQPDYYAPIITVEPQVTGPTKSIGSTLHTTPGVWNARPAAPHTYAWLRNGLVVPGENAQTYTIAAIDIGKRIRSAVIATNIEGSTVALSNVINL